MEAINSRGYNIDLLIIGVETVIVPLRVIKGHEPFPKQALDFMCLEEKSFENTVDKGAIACNEQFLLCPQCFLPVFEHFLLFPSN